MFWGRTVDRLSSSIAWAGTIAKSAVAWLAILGIDRDLAAASLGAAAVVTVILAGWLVAWPVRALRLQIRAKSGQIRCGVASSSLAGGDVANLAAHPKTSHQSATGAFVFGRSSPICIAARASPWSAWTNDPFSQRVAGHPITDADDAAGYAWGRGTLDALCGNPFNPPQELRFEDAYRRGYWETIEDEGLTPYSPSDSANQPIKTVATYESPLIRKAGARTVMEQVGAGSATVKPPR